MPCIKDEYLSLTIPVTEIISGITIAKIKANIRKYFISELSFTINLKKGITIYKPTIINKNHI